MDGHATIERAKAHLEALEREALGYKARIAKLKAGKQDPLDAKALEGRVKEVTAEIATMKKALGKTKDADDPAVDDEVEDDLGS